MGKEARRSYTTEQREEALRLYVEHGPAEAGRRLGIPSATIRWWASRAGKKSPRADRAVAGAEAARLTWAARKAEVALRSGEAATEFLERAIGTGKARERSDWTRAYALAVDKAQLLDGSANRPRGVLPTAATRLCGQSPSSAATAGQLAGRL